MEIPIPADLDETVSKAVIQTLGVYGNKADEIVNVVILACVERADPDSVLTWCLVRKRLAEMTNRRLPDA